MTNLTGTKWLINENPSCTSSSVTSYKINFHWSEDETRTFTDFTVGGVTLIQFLAPTLFIAYKQGTWYNTTTRTIEILGGTDVTNTSLINWMQANAVQVLSSYDVVDSVTHATVMPLMATTGKDYIGTLSPDLGYKSPETVSVNGTSYDVINNQFTVPNIMSSITVSGAAIENPVTDLTGTTWRFNDDGGIIRTVDEIQSFYVKGVIKGDYNGAEVVVESTSSNSHITMWKTERYFSGFVSKDGISEKYFCYSPNQFVNQWVYNPVDGDFKPVSNVRITFSGGTDATNLTLIRWIQANATPVNVTYNVTYNVDNAVGAPAAVKGGDNLSFQITPNSGYLYPSSVTVNGTYNDMTYNPMTGTGTITGVVSDISIGGKAISEMVSVDLTTLSGWSNVTSGQHNLTIVAMGTDYADSLPSIAVNFTRAFKTVKGLYKFIDAPNIGRAESNVHLNFTSNGKTFNQINYGYISDMYQLQYVNNTESITAKEDSTAWTNSSYQIINLGTTAQEVDDTFYEWFTANANVAYTTSTNLTNLSASGTKVITAGETAIITLTASEYYNVPAQSGITVTGATITNYTKTSDTVCKITIANPTANIVITASAVKQTATISGRYKFNSNWEINDSYEQTVNFTSNSQSFKSMHVNFILGAHIESQLLYDQTVAYGVKYSGIWENTAYQTVDFGTTAQTVYKNFYAWFTKNATLVPQYTITNKLTNISTDSTNVETVYANSTATLKYTASTYYELPDTVAVTGASHTWDKSTGILTISNPTTDVVITINGVAEMTTISGKYLFYGDPVQTDFEQTVNFTSNGKTYSKIKGVYTGMGAESPLYYDDTMVFDGDKGEWVSDAYKLVDFGTTAQSVTASFYGAMTNTAKPAVLMLAGKYIFNDTLSITAPTWGDISFTSSGTSYGFMSVNQSSTTLQYRVTEYSGTTTVYNGTWVNNNFKTINITTDTYVQESLANFIETNATKVIEYTVQVSGLDSSVTISPSPLPKITSDSTLEITFTITDTSQYVFNAQSDITVTNATLTKYNKVSDTVCKITIGTATGNVTVANVCKARASAPQNVKVENTVVSWDAVTNADSYYVYVDGTLYENTTGETSSPLTVSYLGWNGSSYVTMTATAGETKSFSAGGSAYDSTTEDFTCSGGNGTYTYTLTKINPTSDDYCTVSQNQNVFTLRVGDSDTELTGGIYAFVISSGDESVTFNVDYEFHCLTGDTLITVSDGSQKRIDELTTADKVLAYNPETMELEADEITYSDSTEHKMHTEYDVYTFSDGSVIKTVHRHRFYNVERQSMVYMDEWSIGEHAVKQDGTEVALIKHENIKEEVSHYTILTKNQNYFANGLLSGNRHTKQLQPYIGSNT